MLVVHSDDDALLLPLLLLLLWCCCCGDDADNKLVSAGGQSVAKTVFGDNPEGALAIFFYNERPLH